MKKKFSKRLLLPLGLSLLLTNAFASAASAAPAVPSAAVAAGYVSAATSGDFDDLAGIDDELKAKIDALLAQGVFQGVGDGTFGIDQNMTRSQFSKVLDLIYNVDVDMAVQTSSFSDVQVSDAANGWAIPYIEAAKKAGLLTGMTTTTYAPSANVTLGQLAAALDRGLGYQPDLTGTPWYADAVQQAISNRILPEGIDGSRIATRADLVVGAFSGQQAYQASTDAADGSATVSSDTSGSRPKLSITQAKQVGAQKFYVGFNLHTDPSTIRLSVTKDGIPVDAQAVPDALNGYTLNLASHVQSGNYVITASSANMPMGTSSATLTAAAETAVKMEWIGSSDTIAKASRVQIPFKITNQFGETMQDASDVSVMATAPAVIDSARMAVIVDTSSPDLQSNQSVVSISLVNEDARISLSKNYKVGTAPLVAKIEMEGALRDNNGEEVPQADGSSSAYHVDFTAYDQYGSSILPSETLLTDQIQAIFTPYNADISAGEVEEAAAGEPGSFSLPILLNWESYDVVAPANYNLQLFWQGASATQVIHVAPAARQIPKTMEIKGSFRDENGQEVTQLFKDIPYHLNLDMYDQQGNKITSLPSLLSALSSTTQLAVSGLDGYGTLTAALAGEPGAFSLPVMFTSARGVNSVMTITLYTATANMSYVDPHILTIPAVAAQLAAAVPAASPPGDLWRRARV
ncbi:S-layer homology domain-containing protein [Paenibacillus protaetiae]|nr:S-layer homology domain-containing protein [Paenibacillus protaetiae]